jgi:putative DNA methylase
VSTLGQAGQGRLLAREDLPAPWNPATDPHPTVWRVTQQLIRALDHDGERGAAALLHRVGALGAVARDLAYRLYTVCQRKGWAQEAMAYNSLVIAWPRIVQLAGQQTATTPQQQGYLDQV